MVVPKNPAPKKAFTTFEVADICDVTPVTIQNWIDKGWLRAYRTPGGHRRVLRDDLLSFLDSRNIPHIFNERIGPPQILIVDDEKKFTELMRDILLLDNPDYEIEIAHDGFRAGLLYGNNRPDVVLLDLMLPGVDGFEVCRQIKQSTGGGDTVVIAVTGLDDPSHEERIMSLGASYFIQKPADTAHIRDLVRQTIDAKGARNPS